MAISTSQQDLINQAMSALGVANGDVDSGLRLLVRIVNQEKELEDPEIAFPQNGYTSTFGDELLRSIKRFKSQVTKDTPLGLADGLNKFNILKNPNHFLHKQAVDKLQEKDIPSNLKDPSTFVQLMDNAPLTIAALNAYYKDRELAAANVGNTNNTPKAPAQSAAPQAGSAASVLPSTGGTTARVPVAKVTASKTFRFQDGSPAVASEEEYVLEMQERGKFSKDPRVEYAQSLMAQIAKADKGKVSIDLGSTGENKDGVDGVFYTKTRNSVIAIQKYLGLPQDRKITSAMVRVMEYRMLALDPSFKTALTDSQNADNGQAVELEPQSGERRAGGPSADAQDDPPPPPRTTPPPVQQQFNQNARTFPVPKIDQQQANLLNWAVGNNPKASVLTNELLRLYGGHGIETIYPGQEKFLPGFNRGDKPALPPKTEQMKRVSQSLKDMLDDGVSFDDARKSIMKNMEAVFQVAGYPDRANAFRRVLDKSFDVASSKKKSGESNENIVKEFEQSLKKEWSGPDVKYPTPFQRSVAHHTREIVLAQSAYDAVPGVKGQRLSENDPFGLVDLFKAQNKDVYHRAGMGYGFVTPPPVYFKDAKGDVCVMLLGRNTNILSVEKITTAHLKEIQEFIAKEKTLKIEGVPTEAGRKALRDQDLRINNELVAKYPAYAAILQTGGVQINPDPEAFLRDKLLNAPTLDDLRRDLGSPVDGKSAPVVDVSNKTGLPKAFQSAVDDETPRELAGVRHEAVTAAHLPLRP